MNFRKIVPFLILILTIPTIVQWLEVDTNKLTILWWIINSLIILSFIKNRKYFYRNKKLPIFIRVFLVLTIVEAVYGLFLSRGYWDYKALVNNLFVYLLPLSIYVFSNPQILSKTIGVWIKVGLVLFFIILPFMQPEAVGKYLIPVLFLSLFIKPLSFKYKTMILLFYSFVFIFGSLGARATVLKYSLALLMGLSLYTPFYRSKVLVNASYALLFLLPVIFLTLGSLGYFNVFEIDKYVGDKKSLAVTNSYDTSQTENLSSDTRTFIYVEALTSAVNQQYVLFGNSLARGYKSPYFHALDFYKQGERYDSEVGVINIFTHYGLLGLAVYFMIFLSASYKAVFYSKNVYMKMLGLYLATRWLFSWIEEFSRFDLNYLFIWIIIGMCYSENYRGMTTKEFEIWIKGIFDIRYRKLESRNKNFGKNEVNSSM
jgi:hypothetical protein